MKKLKRPTKWVCAECKRKGMPRPESGRHAIFCSWCQGRIAIEVPAHGKIKWAKKTLVTCPECRGRWRSTKCRKCNDTKKVLS